MKTQRLEKLFIEGKKRDYFKLSHFPIFKTFLTFFFVASSSTQADEVSERVSEVTLHLMNFYLNVEDLNDVPILERCTRYQYDHSTVSSITTSGNTVDVIPEWGLQCQRRGRDMEYLNCYRSACGLDIVQNGLWRGGLNAYGYRLIDDDPIMIEFLVSGNRCNRAEEAPCFGYWQSDIGFWGEYFEEKDSAVSTAFIKQFE